MDPRFNHTLTPNERQQATSYLKQLYEKIKNISNKEETNKTSDSSNAENIQFLHEADNYLNEYLKSNFKPNWNLTSIQIDVGSKIDQLKLPYARVDCNVLQFWSDKQYSEPELYALSCVCFAVPPTQVNYIYINIFIFINIFIDFFLL